MIFNISKTEKIQSMYQWMLLIRKNNALQCTPRIYTGDLPIHSLYSTIPEIILDSLQLNGYADDHLLRKPFKPGILHELTNNTNVDDETCTIAVIENTMLKVKTWMDAVCLKLNESKTELIYFGSRQQLTKCQLIQLINREIIKRLTKVNILEAS